MRRIVVIGTDHRYQFGGATRTEQQNLAFAALLQRLCEAHGLRCLAEEMSLDALRAQDRTESTVATFARHRGIHHIYCDPSESVQFDMGLGTERNANLLRVLQGWSEEKLAGAIACEHRLREQYWRDRILETHTWPCLLVCGGEHAMPVSSLLAESGLQVALVAERWDA